MKYQLPKLIKKITGVLVSISIVTLLLIITPSTVTASSAAPPLQSNNLYAQPTTQTHKIFLPFVFNSLPTILCDYTIPLSDSKADGRTDYSNVKPGDIVCIEAGYRQALKISNISGTAEKPITFINFGGQVVIDSSTTHGILFQNSQYFRLTGAGSPDILYGIKIIRATGSGVGLGNKSANYEVDHIEISNTARQGIIAKTDAVCSDGSNNNYDYDGDGAYKGDLDDVVNQANFTQRNSIFHDNYIHNVGKEGFYVGSSFYGEGREKSCSNGNETLYDPLLTNVQVYDNRVEYAGWDGLQVGSAIENCNIHHNTINKDSQVKERYQISGIMNNPGSVCNIFSNIIKDGFGPGIYVQGNGNNRIYNNLILGPGQGGGIGYTDVNGIDIASAGVAGNNIFIWNNTIINPKDYGIKYRNDEGAENKIQNNIIVNPGLYASEGEDAYIETFGRTNVTISNNVTSLDIAEVKFTNLASNDYSLQPVSPAVDSGIDLHANGITTDLLNTARPHGAGFEIGAIELE